MKATTLALGLLPMLAMADDEETLDEEFLEYLAEFDDKEDDWSWFDSDDDKPAKQQAQSKTATDKETVKPKP